MKVVAFERSVQGTDGGSHPFPVRFFQRLLLSYRIPKIKVNFRSRPNRKAFDYIVGIAVFGWKSLKTTKNRVVNAIFGLFREHRHD